MEKIPSTSTASQMPLMEFTRFDLGEILRQEHGTTAPRSLRLVAGNPLIMKQMVEHLPDAGSYAPVTILIDERPDGCICLMTEWPVSSLPTKVRKLCPWRGTWTQKSKPC